jgi:hypothetical protein
MLTMKRILILIFIFSSFIAGAQYKTFMSLDTFPVPNNLTAFTFIASKNHVAYLWDISSKKWIPIGGSIDSLFAGIQDQINTKVDQETTITINGDTQPLTGDISFGPFLTGTDTVYLHNQITTNSIGLLVFGDGLHKAGNNVVALHDEALWNASKFQGRAVSGATPLNGQVYVWNDTTLQWVVKNISSVVSIYTDEQAQDAVGAMVTNKFTYNDGANTLEINQGNLSLSSIGGLLNATQIAQGGAGTNDVLKWNGSAWAPGTVSGTTINNNADNRIITGSATANTLEGESTLTFDGSTLLLSGTLTLKVDGGFMNLNAPNGASRFLYTSVGGTTYGYWGVAGASSGIVSGSVLGDQVFRTSANSFLFSTDNGTTVTFGVNGTGSVHIGTRSSDPSSPANGDLYYNTSTDKLKLYAAGAWVNLN